MAWSRAELQLAQRVAVGRRRSRARRRRPPGCRRRRARDRPRDGRAVRCARIVSRAASACKPASVARNQLLATSAAIDWRAYSKSACADAALRGARGTAVAHAAPEIEFPRWPSALRPAGPSRRPTSCRRRAPARRPTGTASRRRASHRAAPARRARRRRGDPRCWRAPRRPRPSCSSLNDGQPVVRCAGPRRRAAHCAGTVSCGQRLLLDGRRIGRLLQHAPTSARRRPRRRGGAAT